MKTFSLTRKSIASALVGASALLSAGPALANFKDISMSNINFDAIEYVKSQGIVSGYPDGTFQSDRKINRAELTKIIIESQFSKEDIDKCDKSAFGFPDVPKDAWFAKYVCVAKMNNIIGGYPDGTFKPAKNISFVEASKIIVITFGYPVDTSAVWYEPFVESLASLYAVPTDIAGFEWQISRGQMAEMIYRLKAKIRHKKSKTYEIMVRVEKGETVAESEYEYEGKDDDELDDTDADAAADAVEDILDDLDLLDDLDSLDLDDSGLDSLLQ